MQQQIDGLPVECGGIVCDDKRLSEIDSGRVMVTVDRRSIERIRLRSGLVSPHPALQAGFGLALIALGYIPAAHLVHWYQHGGRFFEAEALVIPFALIGVWVMITAFRHGRFLEIESAQGRKRFAFRRDASSECIDKFLAMVQGSYGVRIEREYP